MGKILALDFGLKRTGIAITDDSKIFAFGLTTIDSKTLNDFLAKIILKEKIETIVLGEPKRLNNEDSHITQNVYLLKKHLEENFKEQKIVLHDERFTSKMASSVISQSGMSKAKKQNKELIDEISATIILQSYLSFLG
ncbi:MAG: Holliday junction resolvase RuvX [Bacteroidota bacterium]